MKPPRILVLGPGKSGTTGLFYCLRDSAESHFQTHFSTLFEPKTADRLAGFDAEFSIAKILLERQRSFAAHPALQRFTHKVFIFRDPRDNVISRLVYLIATRISLSAPGDRLAVIDALCRKQAYPEDLSVVDLYRLAAPVTHASAAAAKALAYSPSTFLAEPHDYFPLSYEDFIDWNVSGLASYLGFPIKRSYRQPRFKNVKRVAGHGYWKSWFTGEDYAFFVTPHEQELRILGYDPTPYEGTKRIDADEGVGYIERLNPRILSAG